MYKVVALLRSIKFSHSIFALPFALIATLLAIPESSFRPIKLVYIIACMVGARTWAMACNRLIDANIDAKNPRTQSREIPAGIISTTEMLIFALVGATIFVVCAGLMSPLALKLSPAVLIILAFYSWTKRFTWFCHLWLGMCLGLAPLAAWVALQDATVPLSIVSLGLAVMFWVAGFDVLYSLQDEDFDRKAQLHSIPARFGSRTSLWIARGFHVIALAFFIAFGAAWAFSWPFYVALGLTAAFLFAEHWVMRTGSTEKIQLAFFNLNGWIAVVLLVGVYFSRT